MYPADYAMINLFVDYSHTQEFFLFPSYYFFVVLVLSDSMVRFIKFDFPLRLTGRGLMSAVVDNQMEV